MQLEFLTKTECAQFVRNWEVPASGNGTDDVGWAQLRVNMEDYLDRSAAVARLFARLLGTGQRALLWLTEFGIWPSLENRHLFDALRKVCGEVHPLPEAPGHLFAADEGEALISYLQLVIVFGWGGLLLGLENRHRLLLSHDSWALIRSRSDMSALTKALSDFGLPFRVEQ
jgi:hypothetical protein